MRSVYFTAELLMLGTHRNEYDSELVYIHLCSDFIINPIKKIKGKMYKKESE